MFRRAFSILRNRGLIALLRASSTRLSSLLARPAKSFATHRERFLGKSGIEIGGPSQVFSRRGIFPVYPIVKALDNCNFANNTVWDGSIHQGQTFRFDRGKSAGVRHVVEAGSMDSIPSASYDFVLSSHMLEHTANPIRALIEWKRLLKDRGTLVLILPDKKRTFDHRRPVTTLAHLINDFNFGMMEDDLTHLPEILAMHDLARDPDARGMDSFKAGMCQ